MKTQNSKHTLSFNKNNIAELNRDALNEIIGGTMTIPFLTTITDLPNFSKNTLCTSDVK